MTRIDVVTKRGGDLVAVYDSTATVADIEKALKANGYAVTEAVFGDNARRNVTMAGCAQDDLFSDYVILKVSAIW